MLIAFCHLRNDRRTFKLERIVRLTRIEQSVPEVTKTEQVQIILDAIQPIAGVAEEPPLEATPSQPMEMAFPDVPSHTEP